MVTLVTSVPNCFKIRQVLIIRFFKFSLHTFTENKLYLPGGHVLSTDQNNPCKVLSELAKQFSKRYRLKENVDVRPTKTGRNNSLLSKKFSFGLCVFMSCLLQICQKV